MIDEVRGEEGALTATAPLPHLTGDVTPNSRHRVWLAALLSFLFVGAGQFYNRQFAKGLLMFGLQIALGALSGKYSVLIVLCLANSLYSIIDARIIAKTIRLRGKAEAWQFV